MRIVVTGGRAYPDRKHVFAALDAIHQVTPVTALAHGDAGAIGPLTGRLRGADKLAGVWAEAKGIEVVPYPVRNEDWRAYGRGAGPRRNRIMLEAFGPDAVVAFPGGTGTADCCRAARERGIEVLVQRPPRPSVER
jgi:hypothetical protein